MTTDGLRSRRSVGTTSTSPVAQHSTRCADAAEEEIGERMGASLADHEQLGARVLLLLRGLPRRVAAAEGRQHAVAPRARGIGQREESLAPACRRQSWR